MDIFGVRQLPFLTRRNYYFEMLHLLPWGLLAGLVEGNIAAVVVARTFGGGAWLLTIASTTPAAVHLVNLAWGMFCVGRRKLRVFAFSACGVVLFTSSVGLTPAGPWGGWIFVAQMALAQFFMTGVVTARSAVWRLNYPVEVRGRITARLQATRALLGIAVLIAASAIFDRNPAGYRFVYPLAGVCGLLAVVISQKVHVRGERRALGRTPLQTTEPADERLNPGLAEPFSLATLLSPGRVLAEGWRVLSEDRRFRKYCAAQSSLGSSNLIVRAVAVQIMANQLFAGWSKLYLVSIVLLDVLPKALTIGSLRRWGRMFDRVGVVRFRVVHSVCWAGASVFGALGTWCVLHGEGGWPAAVPLAVSAFALRALLEGLALGGGALAWNIGHLHFARAEEAEVYMGIHVSLTGLRGLIMPALGMLLYIAFGWWVWGVALAFSLIALWGFRSLAAEEALPNAECGTAEGETGRRGEGETGR